MAIYHCSVKTVSRGKGGSSVASASYRAAEKLKDLKNEKEFDYTRKQSVDFKQIIGWDGDRESLWNMAELSEKRKDATTAREYEVALPCELSNDQKIKLAVNYGNWLNERHGVAVDVCIHQIDSQNPHAHILTTTRESLGSELGDKVAREWSDTRRKANGLDGRKNDLIEAKAKWADLVNETLEKNQIDDRVSHLSLAEQGIERQPQIHVGYASKEMERRGEHSDRATTNRLIISSNEQSQDKPIEVKPLFERLHLNSLEKRKNNVIEVIRRETESRVGTGFIRERAYESESCIRGNSASNKTDSATSRWKDNIFRNSSKPSYGQRLPKLSEIPIGLSRLPQRFVRDRATEHESGRSRVDPDLLLHAFEHNNVGHDEPKSDAILRRRDKGEQRGCLVEEKAVEVDTVEVKPIVVSRFDALDLNQEVIDQLPELVKYALNKEPPTKEFLDTATSSEIFKEFTIYRDACLKIIPMINEYCCSEQAKLKNPDISKSIDKIDEVLHVQRDSLYKARESSVAVQKMNSRGLSM